MIAFLPIARTTFDIPFAEEKARAARDLAARLAGPIHGPEHLITDMDSARAVVASLSGLSLDLAVIFQATFADATMAAELASQIDAPILLWAVREPQTGGRLRLNSLCGINLAAFALRQASIPYTYLYADPDMPEAAVQVVAAARAGAALRTLRGARIGVVGTRPDGFDPCDYYPAWLEDRLGIEVKAYDLNAAFDHADKVMNEEPARVEAAYAEIDSRLSNLDTLNGAQVRGTLSFLEAMRDWIRDDQLSGLAVRCWPETFLRRDCAICASSSMLSNAGVPASCEADVNGTITALILQTLSGSAAFSADLVAADEETNTGVFWHCGLAPLEMCDPAFTARGTLHTNRQRPLLFEFPLKPGRVTLARLTQAGPTGRYRLVIGSGEMIAAPMQFTGTSGTLRFDSPARHVLDTIMGEGLDHHYSLTYGDWSSALRLFAAFADLEVIAL